MVKKLLENLDENKWKYLASLITMGFSVYEYFKERQFNDTISSPDFVWEKREQLEEVVPNHCKTYYYADNQGRLKATVICETSKGTNIYHA